APGPYGPGASLLAEHRESRGHPGALDLRRPPAPLEPRPLALHGSDARIQGPVRPRGGAQSLDARARAAARAAIRRDGQRGAPDAARGRDRLGQADAEAHGLLAQAAGRRRREARLAGATLAHWQPALPGSGAPATWPPSRRTRETNSGDCRRSF